ncbi:hypothetical protein I6A84_36580 [Frankia sp. CNm7]|uniref:Antitoxin VbhA domain-containing protein n=1 Tax=Frankia nepalensis TaxID=1836974 RepID=A0A937R9Q2_9ACTN|nr:hypothetical protein [Frankia nepalensis]MBL7501404.1 hypothetical protein [Frankia nepalensis]MBL7511931.1 hypothetical protein [Frankia nepalensis]MBL7523428.1 hypothetical protein [Frankia nepalensis]MBL7628248.1 hypothetical protein [Frankia nepalensis]
MPNPDRDLDFRNPDAFAEAEEGRRRDESVTGADGGPVDEAAMRAADGLITTEEVEAAYREHIERGARQKGEGAPVV